MIDVQHSLKVVEDEQNRRLVRLVQKIENEVPRMRAIFRSNTERSSEAKPQRSDLPNVVAFDEEALLFEVSLNRRMM